VREKVRREWMGRKERMLRISSGGRLRSGRDIGFGFGFAFGVGW